MVWQFFHERHEQKPQQRNHRTNRQVILHKVESFWVTGLLQSIKESTGLLNVTCKFVDNLVDNPLHELSDRITHSVYSTTNDLFDIYKAKGGELLILGEPGSGKTTELLLLTEQLVAISKANTSSPIPILLHLASWGEKKLALEMWVIEELNKRYQIPVNVSQDLIEGNTIILLLDGLEQVGQDNLQECTGAINDFRQKNGLISIVVCSRLAEYSSVSTKLLLQGAISIEPLRKDQIFSLLESQINSASVVSKIKKDKILLEMLSSPLFLSLAILIFRDNSDAKISRMTRQQFRDQMFDRYIEQRLHRSTKNKKYNSQKVKYWISWLAKQMSEHGQVELFLEKLQPSWLRSRQQVFIYYALFALVGGIPFGLFSQFVFATYTGYQDWLGYTGRIASGIILFFLTIIGIDVTTNVTTVDIVEWSWRDAFDELLNRTGVILIIAAILSISLAIYFEFHTTLSHGFLNGAIVGFFVPTLVWTRFVLPLIFYAGYKEKQVELQSRPNEGVWRSFRNSVMFSLPYGLICGFCIGFPLYIIVFGVTTFNLAWLTFAIGSGLFVGFRAGVIIALHSGSLVWAQHFIIRLILAVTGKTPWRYVSFLDYTAQIAILRKVGGSYIFFHELLLDHFANTIWNTYHSSHKPD